MLNDKCLSTMRAREQILNYFRYIDERGLLGTSYLFVGKDDGLVSDIVKTLSCASGHIFCDVCWDCKRINQGSHPDVRVIEPEGFTISIDAMRQGMRLLSLKSFRLVRKYMIVRQAHLLSPEAANAFLKTLEEPPPHSFIGMTTAQIDDVLPTIISRCRKIFLPFQEELTYCGPSRELNDFLNGQDLKFKDRQQFSSFLWNLITFLYQSLRSELSGQKYLPKADAYEIILRRLGPNQIQALLADTLEIYASHKTINMNLALQLIRAKL